MKKLFTLFILFLLLPVAAGAQDNPEEHTNHEGWTELKQISNNTLPAGKYYLSDDLECNGTPQTWITITGEVTLCLNGHVLNLHGQSLQVESGAILHLCDCNSTNQTHKFTVGSNGLWQLDEVNGTETLTGGVITGGENRKEGNFIWYGGGVCVNGTFAMSGGNIVGNMSTHSGGGVSVGFNGTFTLSGGSIAGNTCTSSGGGVYVSGGGTFTLSGGNIAGNTGSSGGGVFVDGGTFTLSGGSIAGNTCTSNGGGVCVSGGTFTMSGGSIAGNTGRSGGGVCVYGTFTLSGGGIAGNTCTSNGGGVYVNLGTFTMSGGSIAGNTGRSGGGVCVYGTFTLSGGGIAGNTCTSNGGGVYVNYGTFTMSGAPIVTGNKKTDDSDSNIYKESGYLSIGEGGLSEGAKLGVTLGESNTVVYSWSDEWGNPAEYFTSDNSDYGVGLDDQGNVVLKEGIYSVILYPNDGTIAEGKEVTSYTFGTGATLPTEVTRTGYTFGGWYDNKDFSGEKVEEISATDTGDKKYWAKWTYTVKFGPNCDTYEGTMNDQSFTCGVAQALTSNAFTRTGYTFTGWNTAADGTGTSYEDGTEVSNLTPTDNATVTLYAQWKINSYKITFVNDDGTELQSSMVEYNSTPVFTGTTPTKASSAECDYTFAGWTPAITAVTGDATYTATYTATKRSYTITVEVADGCDGMGEVTGGGTYEYGETTTLTATANSGYRFVKWEEDGETAATREITVTGDATYTALFEQVEKPKPDPKPDPISYYNIYVEDVCDGVEVSTSKQVVREGGSISVYIEKDTANYTFDNFKVYYKRSYYGPWEVLEEGVQPGEYPINNIWTHIYVKAEGAEEKEDPTGIESVEGVKVYTKDGSLYVQTPQREQVLVITMSGAVVKSEEQVGLKQYHGLQPGIYIVRVGDRTYKLRLN